MLEIRSHHHSYRVCHADNVRDALVAAQGEGAPFILLDRKVADLHRQALAPTLEGSQTYLIDASEETKSYEQLTPVFCWLLATKCQRGSHLVVVGGGVVQDIGCFIASVLFRGIRWTLVPTTLLAQCDSCIGSKSSLNVGRYKNQLGTFYPPHEVQLSFGFLRTLTHDEILSGLGEAIKLHLIDGDSAVWRLRQALPDAAGDTPAMRTIVWDCLRIKQRFIEADEFDHGVRNLLNYGHTFAHAFESVTNFAIPHGIAVSMGLAGAAFFSEQIGLAQRGSYDALMRWLHPFFGGYERKLHAAEPGAVLAVMKQDKKNAGDRIMFILTRGAGQMEKASLSAEQAGQLVREFLNAMKG